MASSTAQIGVNYDKDDDRVEFLHSAICFIVEELTRLEDDPVYSANERKQSVNKILQALSEFRDEPPELLQQDDDMLLHRAASSNVPVVLRVLLQKPGADPNQMIAGFEYNPLHMAATRGHVEAMQELLSTSGVDVNAQSVASTEDLPEDGCNDRPFGATALLLAVQEQQDAAVRLLLSVPDVDVNLADSTGDPPLWFAARQRNPEMVRLLLSHPNIDVNAGGDPPLHELKYPLLCGVVVDKPPASPEGAKRQLATLRLLLSSPDIDVNECAPDGATALAMACMHGLTDAAKALIHKQADCNLGPGGSTALHQALLLSVSVDIVKELLKMPSLNLLQKCRNRWTPFDLCSEGEEGTMKEVAGLLLEELRNRNCMSSIDIVRAIIWSIEVGSGWTVELLLHYFSSTPNLEVQTLSAPYSCLHLAARHGSEKAVRALLSVAGIDLSTQENGLLACQIATANGHHGCAKLIIASRERCA